MNDPTTIIRCQTLTQISGLPVSCYERNGERCFVFGQPNQPIKSICTYRKARAFAEGVAAGRVSERATRLKRRIVLDDWVDGHPDSWDYEAVLRENNVTVDWCYQIVDSEGNFQDAPPGLCGWGFYWKNGSIHMGKCSEIIARKAAALFVSLWLHGVSASFADKLMDGYIICLERQENPTLPFLAEVVHIPGTWKHFRLTREGFCYQKSINAELEDKIIRALNPQPNEEVIVTFTKRKTQ